MIEIEDKVHKKSLTWRPTILGNFSFRFGVTNSNFASGALYRLEWKKPGETVVGFTQSENGMVF